MQTCPDCQNIVSETAIFCDICGLQLNSFPPQEPDPVDQAPAVSPRGCSVCGYENMPGETFCQNCGVQLPPVSSTPPPPPTPVHSPLEKEHPSKPIFQERTPSPPASLRCTECGHENTSADKYCQNCGIEIGSTPGAAHLSNEVPQTYGSSEPSRETKPMDISPQFAPPGTCPSCGQTNSPGESFCQNCGWQLSTKLEPDEVPASEIPSNQASTLVQKDSAQLAGTDSPVSFCPTCGIDVSDTRDPYCQNCGEDLRAPGEILSPAYETYPLQSTTNVSALSSSEADLTYIPGRLVLLHENRELRLPSDKRELIIGRSDPEKGIFPDIDLTDFVLEKSGVSRQHARITVRGFQVFVEDLESTNYTYLNKQKLQPGQRYPMNHGDELRFGGAAFFYYSN